MRSKRVRSLPVITAKPTPNHLLYESLAFGRTGENQGINARTIKTFRQDPAIDQDAEVFAVCNRTGIQLYKPVRKKNTTVRISCSVVCFVANDEVRVGWELTQRVAAGKCLERCSGDMRVGFIAFSHDDADITGSGEREESLAGLVYEFDAVRENERSQVMSERVGSKNNGFAPTGGNHDRLATRS